MMVNRKLLLALAGPLLLGSVLSTPAEACWLFGCCGGRAAYRPVYAGYGGGWGMGMGWGSGYYPYAAGYGYGGYSGGGCGCNMGGCGSGGGCGCDSCSMYPSFGCDSCGGGGCSNCAGGNCNLPATGPVPMGTTPQSAVTPPDMDSKTGESVPTGTFRGSNSPPPDATNPPPNRSAIPEDDPAAPRTNNTNKPEGTLPPVENKTFKGTTEPPAKSGEPAAPKADEASLGAPEKVSPKKDGAGFRDDLKKGDNVRPPLRVNVDDKVAYAPATTRSRMTIRPSYKTARLVRAAAYPSYAWIPDTDAAQVAKK